MNNSENGPLRVIALNDQNHSFGVRDNHGFRCFLPKVHHYTGQDERYQKEVSDITAFAHLFAAAPDLLAALEKIVNKYNGLSDGDIQSRFTNGDFFEAEAAIKKAKGLQL